MLDEIPGANKGIDQVMANQAYLTRVLQPLQQILNINNSAGERGKTKLLNTLAL